MATSIISASHFHNENAAYAFVESRIWPNGPVCPHCACVERISKMRGKSTRAGVYKCYDCRRPFTVKVGTIFESSHVPLRLWLQAIFLIASSKKGISSNQLHRTLGVTLKTAWFMGHRIREAMRVSAPAAFGEGGGTVEVDETFIGQDQVRKRQGFKKSRGYQHKQKVLSLVDRSSGQARSTVVEDTRMSTVVPILKENIAREAHVITDEASQYMHLHHGFASHKSVNHSAGEYVSAKNAHIHTNTIEGYFSIFKRGMKGVYQHCAHNHLNRYLAEFDFRYSNRVARGFDDSARAEKLLAGVLGKRLTYQTTAH